MLNKGRVIYFEGVDGSGKGTQIREAKNLLISLGYKVEIVRQPGETELGKSIRSTLLESTTYIDHLTQTYLFAADRAETNKKILNLVLDGKVVLCDRSILSSIVYQEDVEYFDIVNINQAAMGLLKHVAQDYILYSVSGTIAYDRMQKRAIANNTDFDNIEKRLDGYVLSKLNGSYERTLNMITHKGYTVNADENIELVTAETYDAIKDIMGVY